MADRKPETFVCAMCGGEFEKDWTDEEAEAEYAERWPGMADARRVVICEDCFKLRRMADDGAQG